MPLSPDEAVMSDLLEDLSASQPPPPPDRYRAVRRRTIRRYWHQATAMGVVLAVVAAGLTLVNSLPPAPPARSAATHGPPPFVRPSYLGVYVTGITDTYQRAAEFAKAGGVRPDLIGYVTGWAQPFPGALAEMAYAHGASAFVQIAPINGSVSAIAAGEDDSYLRSYADSVRHFGHHIVIGFGPEMISAGRFHSKSPTAFVAAWRHIVTVFRNQGADNVTWVWTVPCDTASWGPISSWWPGDSYVNWIGIDGGYYHRSDTFASVFGPAIGQLQGFASGYPLLLSLEGITRHRGRTAQILDLYRSVSAHGALGVVWYP
jgi:hypothetical protein